MPGIGDFASQAGFKLPSMAGAQSVAMYGGIALVLAICLFAVFYWYLTTRTFNQNIKLFKKINGSIIPVWSEKAKFARIGRAGDQWCVTQKLKKYLPKPKIAAGRNTYWFYEREDGEWFNFSIEDIDVKMREAKVHYIDEDMRLQRLGIYKNLEQRYEKKGFWERYGSFIVTVVVIILFFTFQMISLQHMGKVSDKFSESTQTLTNAMDKIAGVCEYNGMSRVMENNGTIIIPTGGQALT